MNPHHYEDVYFVRLRVQIIVHTFGLYFETVRRPYFEFAIFYELNKNRDLLCGRNVTFSLVHEGGMNELGIDTHQNICVLHCFSLVLQNWASCVWLEAAQNGFRNFLLRHF